MDSKDKKTKKTTQIVCIGASAGGLEALEGFFRRLSEKVDAVFIVIQHLSPDFKSVMGELLHRYTKLPTCIVEEGIKPKTGTIYLIPPGKSMTISDGVLHLYDRKMLEQHHPINIFLESMTKDVGDKGIAIILSGTGSDGADGIKSVHQAGGLVLAQDPNTAQFDGMPSNALATGVVDFTGGPDELADYLMMCQGQFAYQNTHKDLVENESIDNPKDMIFNQLASSYGLDFNLYKDATILRRLERRMQMKQFVSLEEYAKSLLHDKGELDRLYRDLLIEVTSFFRDAKAFTYLSENVLFDSIKKFPEKKEFRVWISGCATGEEVYSLAITLDEIIKKQGRSIPLKIFATDVHKESLRVASVGIYAEEKMIGVSDKRRKSYFEKVEEGWRIIPNIRSAITFAIHNVLKDPPFMHLNLISCRNLLIYFNQEAQRYAIRLFNLCLENKGILFLGGSESIQDAHDHFKTIQLHHKIFQKSRDMGQATLPILNTNASTSMLRFYQKKQSKNSGMNYNGTLQNLLLKKFMPSGFLVNEKGELVHTFGGASRYLSLEGPMSANISTILGGNLRLVLSVALERVKKNNQSVRYNAVNVALPENASHLLDVTVEPLYMQKEDHQYFYVILEESKKSNVEEMKDIKMDEVSQKIIEKLESELQQTRENLQTTVEELETSNEELQATNEELMAANQELQSTNEELQSVNEELHSVNVEYQEKNSQLTELNRDIMNLMECTDIGTIFLDSEFRVRRFTPSIARTFYLRNQDIGRSIEEINTLIKSDVHLLESVKYVLEKGEVEEREIITMENTTMLQRVHPYKDEEGNTCGVAITYVDLSIVKQAEEKRRMADQQRIEVLESLRKIASQVPGVVYQYKIYPDGRECFPYASEGIREIYRAEPQEVMENADKVMQVIHKDDYDKVVASIQCSAEKLLQWEQEYRVEFSDGTVRWLYGNAMPERHHDGSVLWHGFIMDITDRKKVEEELESYRKNLEIKIKERTFEMEQEVNKHKETEQKLQEAQNEKTMILNTLKEAVVYIDSNFNIVWANQAAQDYPNEVLGSIVGEKCYKVWHNRALQCEVCPAVSAMETGEVCFAEKMLPSGIVWSVTSSPVKNEKGQIIGVIETMIDITERIKLERDLIAAKDKAEQANAAKSLFLANMSHEIRTPINGVLGFLTLLDQTALDLKQTEYIEHIKSSSKMLLNVINDILDISKIESNNFKLEKEIFNLSHAIETTVMPFTSVAKSKGLSVHLLIKWDVPQWVIGDEVRLKQVLANLISNAVKFSEKGEVYIEVGVKKGMSSAIEVVFKVKDTGIGISAKQQLKLFNIFTQGDDSLTRKFGGTGLGLAICKRIVEMMGGRIWIESEKAKGSTFTFTVNFKKAQVPESECKTIINNQLKEKNILIVDDEKTNYDIAKYYLEALGAKVYLAKDSKQAQAMLYADSKSPEYSLVILDSKTKDIKIKEGIPFILQASMSENIEIDKIKIQGFASYITKPYRREDFISFVIETIGKGSYYKRLETCATSEALAEEAGSKIQTPISILLVEDNEINIKYFTSLLNKNKLRCDVAVNGEEAVAACKKEHYDLVFMDCQMPGVDGYEATRLIRTNEKDKHQAVIIALTAHAMLGDRDKCLEAGMDDYLSKPVRPQEIENIIIKYFAQKEKIDAHEHFKEITNRLIEATGFDGATAEELVNQYYNTAIELLADIKEKLKQENIEGAAMLLHQLKGVAGNIRANEVAHHALEAEKEIKERDKEKIYTHLMNIEKILESNNFYKK